MLQVKRVVNRVFSSNTYVLFDEDFDECWLVDIGDYESVRKTIPDEKKIKGVFLTHTHFDHIYGINELCDHSPDCIVYTSVFGKEALFNDKKNLSRYHDYPIVFRGNFLRIVEDGEAIPVLGTKTIEVVATPGHDPSCLTFCLDEYIFTGDAYIPNVKVVTKLPGGDRLLAAESVNRILRLSNNKIICPGHGDVVNSNLNNKKVLSIP